MSNASGCWSMAALAMPSSMAASMAGAVGAPPVASISQSVSDWTTA